MRQLSQIDEHNHHRQRRTWLAWPHVSVQTGITMKVYLCAPLLGLQLLGRGGLGGYVVLDLGVRHGVGGVELLVGVGVVLALSMGHWPDLSSVFF